MILLMWESLRERSNGFFFGVWMRHFKTQNERECFCHSFWYPLQTPADHARLRGKKKIADMIDNFQVWVCRLDLKLLINIFQDFSVKYFCLNLIVFSFQKFQGNQGARCCLNGLRFLFLTIYFLIKDEKYCSSFVASIFMNIFALLIIIFICHFWLPTDCMVTLWCYLHR